MRKIQVQIINDMRICLLIKYQALILLEEAVQSLSMKSGLFLAAGDAFGKML
jgi:hypothetical protein